MNINTNNNTNINTNNTIINCRFLASGAPN